MSYTNNKAVNRRNEVCIYIIKMPEKLPVCRF